MIIFVKARLCSDHCPLSVPGPKTFPSHCLFFFFNSGLTSSPKLVQNAQCSAECRPGWPWTHSNPPPEPPDCATMLHLVTMPSLPSVNFSWLWHPSRNASQVCCGMTLRVCLMSFLDWCAFTGFQKEQCIAKDCDITYTVSLHPSAKVVLAGVRISYSPLLSRCHLPIRKELLRPAHMQREEGAS